MAYYRGVPVKESSSAFIIVIILALVFAAIIVILLFENSNVKSKLIEPGNCPQITGDYGVIPNVDTSTVGGGINSCNPLLDPNGTGVLGGNACTFNTVKSLIDAEVICNNFPGVCKGFSYIPPSTAGKNGSMSFYNTSFIPKSEPVVTTKTVADVYTKQV
jgi:hypothetical protein